MHTSANDAIRRSINEMITEKGYGMVVVGDPLGLMTICSIGFTERGLPELVFSVSVSTPSAVMIFNNIAAQWEELVANNNMAVQTNGAARLLIEADAFRIHATDPDKLAPYVVEFHEQRYGKNQYRINALTFSDYAGRFPEDPQFCADFIQVQFNKINLH